jgi:hypothetical protein
LDSPEIEDNLLALLCRMENETEAIRTILLRIAGLAERPRRDAIEKLLILSGLRSLKTLIRQEVAKMPITLNLQDNEFFREAFEEGMEEGRDEGRDEGREEGERRLLEKQARLRFGPLPDWGHAGLGSGRVWAPLSNPPGCSAVDDPDNGPRRPPGSARKTSQPAAPS